MVSLRDLIVQLRYILCTSTTTTPSIPVLRAHFANLLAQGYLSLALILLSIFSFIRALAHALVVCMRYVFIHAHALEHAKWN
jgi:hypothetical protein